MPSSRTTYIWISLFIVTVASIVIIGSYVKAREKKEITQAAVDEIPAPVIPTIDPYTSVRLTAESAIIVDLTNGQTLYSMKPDQQMPLASLTKLLTLYAAVQALSPETPIIISETAAAQEGESGLMAGQVFSFEELAKLTLVVSSNDGAQAIAEAASAAAQVSDTRSLLAGAASAVGLSQTYATNGTGLDETLDTAGAYGSARDIAKLAKALIEKAPWLVEPSTHRYFQTQDSAGAVHAVKNTNQDVVRLPGLLLSKTGFTDLAGGNLVIVFDAAIDHPVAIVVMGSTQDDRFSDVERLAHATIERFAYQNTP